MSGIRVSARATELVGFSRPYAQEEIAFLVPDHRREEFADVSVLARSTRA